MKYSDLKHVLDENRAIFRQIADHSRGGPAPEITGFPPAALHILKTPLGRNVSRELTQSIKNLRTELQNWDQWESLEGKKRPEEALRSHVSVSSTFVASYVGRFMHLLEEGF